MDAIKEGMLASAKAAEAAARIGERLFCQNTQSVMNFKSQICTDKNQSERLLSLGLKKETADMCYRYVNTVKGEKKYELIVEAAWSQEVIDEYVRFGTKIGLFDNLVHPCGKPVTPLEARADVTKNDIPAWSLHRLIEILDTNPFVFYTNCGYDTVIDHVEEYIRSGFIDTRYLEEWCLNEEE